MCNLCSCHQPDCTNQGHWSGSMQQESSPSLDLADLKEGLLISYLQSSERGLMYSANWWDIVIENDALHLKPNHTFPHPLHSPIFDNVFSPTEWYLFVNYNSFTSCKLWCMFTMYCILLSSYLVWGLVLCDLDKILWFNNIICGQQTTPHKIILPI